MLLLLRVALFLGELVMENETNIDEFLILKSRLPAEGMIWQCQACGKKAEELYGEFYWHSLGWDESCITNAVQVPKE